MRRRSPSIERREPAPDAEVDAGARVLGVLVPHVLALDLRHHLERQLVVVAQEDAPLTGVGNARRALDDVDERLAVLEPERHEHARHDREVKRHVELVAVAEVRADVLRPHVGFGQQHLAGEVRVEPGAQLLQHGVRLGQVLARRALALDEVGDRVHAKPVDAEIEPELHHLPDLFANRRVVVVEVGLMAEEPVPVVRLRDRIPGPVRQLGVDEDDADAAIAIVGVAPHVPVATRVVGASCALPETRRADPTCGSAPAR